MIKLLCNIMMECFETLAGELDNFAADGVDKMILTLVPDGFEPRCALVEVMAGGQV